MAKVQKRFIGLAALVAVFFLSATAGWGAIDPSTVRKLVAGYPGDYFGWSVSVSGNTAVISSPDDDDNGRSSGSAYVFVRNGDGSWNQQAKLLPDDGAAYDKFGISVSVSSNTAVIGARGDNDNGSHSGSAYIFVRDGTGSWSQQAKLLPDDGAAEDYFGYFVSISGDIAVISAHQDDDNGTDSGSAYAFVRDGTGSWNQQAKLLPDDGAVDDYFGWSVSISGNIAVIGAYQNNDNGIMSGSVYIFVRNGDNSWNQQTKILPDDGVAGDKFGFSVSISGNTVVIGSPVDDDNGSGSGSAYIFVRNEDGSWSQHAKLLPDDGTADDYFGQFVSVSGDIAVISSSIYDYSYNSSAYIFVHNEDDSWSQHAKLLPVDDYGGDRPGFGQSVSVSGNITVIGAYKDNDNSTDSGAAYIYSSTPTTSNVTVTVTAPAASTTYNHGNQVTINWQTENADPADTMVLSMKRDAASTMSAPDGRSWYRFTENTPNDGSETVTIPDSVVVASDWRFYVRHVASNAYDAADATVTLEEAPNTHKLYVTKTGEGSGSITSNPGILSCGDACKNTNVLFANGETVVLTAMPSNCSKLVGWEKCDGVVNDNTCTVTMNEYREAIAQFASEGDTGTLRVLFNRVPYEKGHVTSDPLGIIASSTDTYAEHRFCVGDTVRLTAQAAVYPRTAFNGWTINNTPNNPCNGDQNSNVCDVTITSDMLVVHPSFLLDTTQPYNLHVRISGYGKGHVTSQMRNLNCGNDGTGTTCDIWLNNGNQDTLSAVAAPGSKFVKWSGWGSLDCNGKTDPNCPYTMRWPHEIEAIFSAEDLGVSVSASVDALVIGIDTSFEVLIKNNTDEDSHQTTVDINTLVNEQPYDQLAWQCGDNTGKGTCQKLDLDTFQVTVNGGQDVVITAGSEFAATQKKVVVITELTNDYDANIYNNHDEKEIQLDPDFLNSVASRTLLKFHSGQSSDASTRNTIIFTHGWQPFNTGGCETRKGTDRLECYGKELWTGGNAFQQGAWLTKRNGVTDFNSPNTITGPLNVIQYIWQGAFTDGIYSVTPIGKEISDFIIARNNIATAGKILGKELVAALTTGYAKKVHLIGHSMGTAVNAHAVRYLLNHVPTFLDQSSDAQIQMTFLDHPNRIQRIVNPDNIVAFRSDAVQYGFDKDWFAELLPELDNPLYRDKLLVDNYFAEDTKFMTAGVGTPITGVNVYNHETITNKGLHDPNDMGDTLFTSEGFINNDHTGVHQWYRWTMWPSRKDGLTDNNFVCSNRVWPQSGATSCSGALQPSPQLLQAEEAAAPLFSAETIDTDASYAAMEINVSHDVDRISFEYQFNNNVEKEYVHLLLDGRIAWSLDEAAAENGAWEATGKIPVALEKGKHHLMLVYNQQTDTSSFAMQELQFFEAPSKNGFLPAMLFLLLNK